MGRMDGKIAFVTGAARGQGRNHAIRLAQEGADIIAVDICEDIEHAIAPLAREEQFQETAAAVEAAGRRVHAARADIRDHAGLKAVLDEGVEKLGGLDVVVANAAVLSLQSWNDVTPAIWNAVIETNLTGTWNTCDVAARHLVDRGGGSMILISSVAGIKGQPFLLPYTAAKHGVVGIMRSLANELAEHMIRVNTIHPTGVNTAMGGEDGWATIQALAEAHPDLMPILANSMPIQQIDVDDVSNGVVFLASDESRYVTGLELKIDAGATAR